MKSFENIKSDFPIFERKINGKPLTYLDSGATSQKPNVVLEKMNEIYKNFMNSFSSLERKDYGIRKHPGDKSGKSTAKDIVYFFNIF